MDLSFLKLEESSIRSYSSSVFAYQKRGVVANLRYPAGARLGEPTVLCGTMVRYVKRSRGHRRDIAGAIKIIE
jgi:hypothetical protein